MDENTATQLCLIREIHGVFTAAAVQWWLYGGWAIDAHLGEVTRDHSDIELVIPLKDAPTARDALVSAGFTSLRDSRSDEGEDLTKEGQRLELVYVLRNEDNEMITPGRLADWPWIPGSFDGPSGRLDSLSLPVVSVESLLDIKENFLKHADEPLREKDLADIDHLRRLMAERKG